MDTQQTEYSEEKELIKALVKREPKAQRVLYDLYSSRMFPICIRYVGERERAKDILHDGFITIFEKVQSYSEVGSFEGWMRRIFINTSLMYLRKSDALKFSENLEVVDRVESTNITVIDELASVDILKTIASMPTGFRTVFNLYAIEGYTHQEIAKELKITESSSRSQFSRARAWLQQRISEII